MTAKKAIILAVVAALGGAVGAGAALFLRANGIGSINNQFPH